MSAIKLKSSEYGRYGARVFLLRPQKTLLVKQTIKRRKSGRFVIDGHRERFVSIDNGTAIADAIRQAVSGRLPRGR